MGFNSARRRKYCLRYVNITSGVTDGSRYGGATIVGGSFIGRNTEWQRFFHGERRATRTFRCRRSTRGEATVRGFKMANRRNNLSRNTNFGSGNLSVESAATFGQITAVGDGRSSTVGTTAAVLERPSSATWQPLNRPDGSIRPTGDRVRHRAVHKPARNLNLETRTRTIGHSPRRDPEKQRPRVAFVALADESPRKRLSVVGDR